MIYTKSQMLSLWRNALGIDTLRSDMTLSRVDGIDIDAYIGRRMRLWYLGLLDTAPLDRLTLTDIAAGVTAVADGCCARIDLPDGCRRVASVALAGWQRAVGPVGGDEARRVMARAASPYTLPGICEPAVVACGRSLLCMPATTPTVASLMAVIDPGPESYVLDESLLATIPQSIDPYAL
ncbi:MAG: hypothetical protein Q4C34_03880 [Bacteroidales bacterium]|nr:hypothetical protein [Bacteroidales bacterium]